MTDSAPIEPVERCPDCMRPIATELGPISPKRPCARHLHPVGAEDCMLVALEWKDERIAKLESELSTLREREQHFEQGCRYAFQELSDKRVTLVQSAWLEAERVRVTEKAKS